MATRDFDTLAVRLQPSVPGCPRPTIIQYIRNAAIKACEQTLAWRYEQPVFTLTPGTYVYNFNKPFDTIVHAVFGTFVNNEPLEVLTLDRALVLYPEWASRTTDTSEIAEKGSNPRSITQISPHQFAVLPLPDATETYSVRMIYALKPTRTATGMDEAAFDELEDVIMHGALQELLVLPSVQWSDRELASYHAKQFRSQLTERRARANLGNSRGSVMVQLPKFGV